MNCLQAIESLPRAIVICYGGLWGLTDVENSKYVEVAKYETLVDAIKAFAPAVESFVPDVEETEHLEVIRELSKATIRGGSFAFTAEYWPENASSDEEGWLRPFNCGGLRLVPYSK